MESPTMKRKFMSRRQVSTLSQNCNPNYSSNSSALNSQGQFFKEKHLFDRPEDDKEIANAFMPQNAEIDEEEYGFNKQHRRRRITRQKPFSLTTEQRGRLKEEALIKKVQLLIIEEHKLRIPIAQGLPYTTDEPECLIKPPVKESTRHVDLVLNSDIRAVKRAEFDHQVAEKLNLAEQYRMERDRKQKLVEEEEVRRLRKELVPKAQPMPYFDRPFIPKRSMKHPTVPKDPKFHIPEHKKMKCCESWDDMSMSTFTYR